MMRMGRRRQDRVIDWVLIVLMCVMLGCLGGCAWRHGADVARYFWNAAGDVLTRRHENTKRFQPVETKNWNFRRCGDAW